MSRDIHDGRHVSLHCETHPDLHWHCKIIAVTRTGHYNGVRNIFPSQDFECPCPGSALIIDDEFKEILAAYHAQD